MSNDALNVDINQQLVLVTGGARGLGEEITKSVFAHGGSVVINYYRSRERAQAIADAHPGKAWAIQADVTDRASVDGLFAEAERSARRPITSVVNNALVDFSFDGDARPKAEDIKFERFDQQFRGAVGGALNVIQAALDGFDRNGGGRIVNIGTNLFQNPVVPYHDYTAAKAALLSLTRTFAADLGPKNVTVNMVSGGLLRVTDASAATPEAVFDGIAAGTPLGHVTTPAEFADAALLFLSPLSRAVTGQNLVVDGGLVKD